MAQEWGAQIGAELSRIQSDARALGDASGAAEAIAPAAALGGEPSATGFADSFKNALYAVNQQDVRAGEKVAAVDNGSSDDLVGAMLSSQEASLSFSMLMQVRNKVMGALDEVIKLQL